MRRREVIGLIASALVAPHVAFAQAQMKIARVGFLGPAPAANYAPRVEALRAGLRELGYVEGTNLNFAFRWADAANVDGLLVISSSFTFSRRALLADLAIKHRLPSVFGTKDNVFAGGLLSYAPDLRDLYRQAATYVDKILRGAKPADLPVEQASRYELVINLKTAKTLGIAIPPTLLARADEVIE